MKDGYGGTNIANTIQLNTNVFMKFIVVCVPKYALQKGKRAGEIAQWLTPHAKGENS